MKTNAETAAPRPHDDDLRSAAFAAALDALSVPAFLLCDDAFILDANVIGWTMVAHEGAALAARLRAVLEGRALLPGFDLVRLALRGSAPSFLALHTGPSVPDPWWLLEVAVAWHLTLDERAVLELLVQGCSTRVVSAALGITTAEVDLHVIALLRKARVDDSNTLVAAFWSHPREPPIDGRA